MQKCQQNSSVTSAKGRNINNNWGDWHRAAHKTGTNAPENSNKSNKSAGRTKKKHYAQGPRTMEGGQDITKPKPITTTVTCSKC